MIFGDKNHLGTQHVKGFLWYLAVLISNYLKKMVIEGLKLVQNDIFSNLKPTLADILLP